MGASIPTISNRNGQVHFLSAAVYNLLGKLGYTHVSAIAIVMLCGALKGSHTSVLVMLDSFPVQTEGRRWFKARRLNM